MQSEILEILVKKGFILGYLFHDSWLTLEMPDHTRICIEADDNYCMLLISQIGAP